MITCETLPRPGQIDQVTELLPMQKPLGKNNLVLLGIGHTNAHVLKQWRMNPIPNTQLICVSNFSKVTYSGMLPAVLAGQSKPESMEIDLVRLCSVSSAELIVDQVVSIDRKQRKLVFANRQPLDFDLLSIGIGSVPKFEGVEFASRAPIVAIKPMQTFLARLEKVLARIPLDSSLKIAIVGGGIGGTEIAFCLNQRLKQHSSGRAFQISLINGSENILEGCLPSTVQRIKKELVDAGIQLMTGNRVSKVWQNQLELADQERLDVDLVLWATSAVAPESLSAWDFDKDDRGFILTRPTLQTVCDDRIFAVGDTGTIEQTPTPKAGVYAVRQGPVLWQNLNRLIAGQQPQPYRPQSSFLKLINLGDGRALAEHFGRTMVGRWCWKWKDRIDTRFMKMYQDYRPMKMKLQRPATETMRCVGCGGKIGGAALESALEEVRFHQPAQKELSVVGLNEPDDAAILQVPDSRVTITSDYFASPLPDPYLFGRMAALNGASDCFAMGAQPYAALAIAQIPFGHPLAQQRHLVQLMAGANREFAAMDTAIVGGHSIEGPRMALGFTVLAQQAVAPLKKSNLQHGQDLIVTKALGTGALLAGWMQGKCRARWFEDMLESMFQSNSIALELAQDFGIQCMTDVTGFGLLGHLHEMLVASQLSARLDLNQVPLLPGFQEMFEQGIESTLTKENRSLESMIDAPIASDSLHLLAALFDPQTCGGLLIAADKDSTDAIVRRLREKDYQARVVGATETSSVAGQIRFENS